MYASQALVYLGFSDNLRSSHFAVDRLLQLAHGNCPQELFVAIDEAQVVQVRLAADGIVERFTSASTPKGADTSSKKRTVILPLLCALNPVIPVAFAGTKLGLIDAEQEVDSFTMKIAADYKLHDYCFCVGTVLDDGGVLDFLGYYFGQDILDLLETENPELLTELSETLVGRMRIAATFVVIVLRTKQKITAALLAKEFEAYKRWAVTGEGPFGKLSFARCVKNWIGGQHGYEFLRPHRNCTSMAEALKSLAYQYQVFGDRVRFTTQLEADWVPSSLVMLEQVTVDTVTYSFCEPLVMQAICAQQGLQLGSILPSILRDLLVPGKGCFFDRIVCGTLVTLQGKSLGDVQLFQALPAVLRRCKFQCGKVVQGTGAQFVSLLQTGEVVQPSTMVGADVAVRLDSDPGTNVVILVGCRLYSENLEVANCQHNYSTTDILHLFCRRDGQKYARPWAKKADRALRSFAKNATVIRVVVCLPGIRCPRDGAFPAELQPGHHQVQRTMGKGAKARIVTDHVIVVTKSNMGDLFSPDVCNALASIWL
eukprot:TRINITY_DN7749_c0_g1_i2.p1 TRINITY_DN7749_c0_g1~~TRINITY_DN7749_c0_g1_i2.p1  ORF type:complete len:540 (-),score=70.17 TRINITY_DN7749_c0_g1_i2:95-1714(-)